MLLRSIIMMFLGFTCCFAETLIIKGKIRQENAEKIHEIFVLNSGIDTRQTPPDRYTVTLGAIEDVDAEDVAPLIDHINAWLGNKDCNKGCLCFSIDIPKCACGDVLIMGTFQTSRLYKANMALQDFVKTFTSTSGKKYCFTKNTAVYFMPHINVGNLGNTPCDVSIEEVMELIKDRIDEDRLIENCHLYDHPIDDIHVIKASEEKPVPAAKDRERSPVPELSDAIFHMTPTELPKSASAELEALIAPKPGEEKKEEEKKEETKPS